MLKNLVAAEQMSVVAYCANFRKLGRGESELTLSLRKEVSFGQDSNEGVYRLKVVLIPLEGFSSPDTGINYCQRSGVKATKDQSTLLGRFTFTE